MRVRRAPDGKLIRRRTNGVLCLLALMYVVLGARFFQLQVIQADHYRWMAERYRLRKIILPARRGAILDCNGNPLAITIRFYDIEVWPPQIKDRNAAADKLAKILGWPRSRVLERISVNKNFVFLERKVGSEVGRKIDDAEIYGVHAKPIMSRMYPGGQLASHIIGFTNIDGEGQEGLELVFDKLLTGEDGYVVAEVDARGLVIPGTRRERVEPRDGMSLVLTVDSTLQHSLETELSKSYNRYSAAGASAVLIEPRTGAILALANMPTFDPNKVAQSKAGDRRNRAVTDLYEPGSTLKTITACAALDSQAIDCDDTFGCSGSMRVGNRTVRCSLHPPFMHGHGRCTVSKMLMHSCNMAAAGIAFRVGKEKLWEYEKKFGFFDKPGTGMLGETTGYPGGWANWEDVRLANIGFGQGIVVSPLQLANAYSTVANDGVMMRPYVVSKIIAPDGKVFREYKPEVVRRVISADVARKVGEMLHGVCGGGTGKPAVVDGYQTGGKTGSAQKVVNGRYSPDKFVASFVGFLPTSNPRAVILVEVDEPKGIHWGAVCAAPVFKEIGRMAMWHMKVAPDAVEPGASVAGRQGGGATAVRAGEGQNEPRRPNLGG